MYMYLVDVISEVDMFTILFDHNFSLRCELMQQITSLNELKLPDVTKSNLSVLYQMDAVS